MNKIGLGDLANFITFYKHTGRFLNLKNPKTWSEKLFWLNKYWQPDIKSVCADKYRVRDFIVDKGLGDILLPLLGVWSNADEIDFGTLPNRFVLKCNHGCGCNIIVEDKSKLNLKEARLRLNEWLKIDYSLSDNEHHYAKIEPVIICEQFLPVKNYSEVIDFKIHCFHGEPKWIGICYERDIETRTPKEIVYSPHWDRLMYLKGDRIDDGKYLERPTNLDRMLNIAKTLSVGFPYVRVDLYSVGEKIFFGELTFTPSGNMPEGEYAETVATIAGDYIDLSKVEKSN